MTRPLNISDMLCFSLYSASHAMTHLYRPLLAPLGLTYPQYLVLVALWAEDGQNVRQIGTALGLESNTLTPLLKRMEDSGLISRTRSRDDERMVTVSLTEKARALQPESDRITRCILDATGLSIPELIDLRQKITTLKQALTSHAEPASD